MKNIIKSGKRWKNLKLEIERKVLDYMNSLPEKDRRILKEHLVQLEEPAEALMLSWYGGICRMHIAHSYTAFSQYPLNVSEFWMF